MPDPEQRALTPADIPACLSLSVDAGWNQTAEDWALVIASGPAEGLFVAGRLVATAAAVFQGAHHGWIAMVLTDPPERGKGHARRLLNAIMGRLAEAGRGAGLDATALGQPLYERLGFTAIADFPRYSAEAPSPQAVSSPGTVRLAGSADAAAIAAYDTPAFGADRTMILAHLLTRVPQAAHVAEYDGAISGYVLARDGVRATQIGALVADDPDTAAALLAAALKAIKGPVFIDASAAQPAFCATLDRFGFTPQRTFSRMVLGPPRKDNAIKIFAIVGPEFG